ncbi:MAG: RnfABCDGE type electron transport complex subunit D, partial [Treponema sp.]|nr:RnfABCDGE type electron transport complex subunit D [Treponema sp.]
MADKTPSILLQSSPHISSPISSAMMMGMVLIALTPVSIFGVIIFGLPALLNIIVSVAAAIAGESLFRLAIKQPVRAKDLSAGVSGLLLALVIPPSTPLWMTALGAVFAVVVAKEFFGGLGANVFNPALTGRAFLVMSFPAALTTWTMPRLPQNAFANGAFSADVITGASTLGITRTGEGVAAVSKALAEAGLSNSDSYWAAMKTLFFGYRAGSTGETSVFLILAALIFLVATKTIDWRTPVCMIATGLVSSVVLGMDPLLTVLSGGLVFGAVFMATDYVTTPVT